MARSKPRRETSGVSFYEKRQDILFASQIFNKNTVDI